MQKTNLTRVFQYSGIKLPDPDSSMNPIEVRDFFAMAGRPELSSAEVRGPEIVGEELIYTLHRAVGTKGMDGVAETIIHASVKEAMISFCAMRVNSNSMVNEAIQKLHRTTEVGKAIAPPSELIPWWF